MLRFRFGFIIAVIGVFFMVAERATAQTPDTILLEDEAFAAVFANPADLVLNFQLVAAQLRNRNIKGAIATLERILIFYENNSAAQTLLAQAQYRLGNIAEAQRQAQRLLANPDATPEQKDNITNLIERIEAAKRVFDIDGVVILAAGFIDNIEGASIDNNAVVADSFIAGGLNRRRSIRGFNSISAAINLTGNLEAQRPEQITLGLNAARRRVAGYPLGGVDSAGASLRYLKSFGTSQITLSGALATVQVDGRRYAKNATVSATMRHILGENWLATANISNSWNKFRNGFDRRIAGNALPSMRDGQSRNASLRLVRAIDGVQWGVSFGLGRVSAKGRYNARRQYSIGLDASLPAFAGVVVVGARHSASRYDAADDRFFSHRARADKTYSINASYSIGLGESVTILEQAPQISLMVQYGKTESNIANFSRYFGDVSLRLIQPF